MAAFLLPISGPVLSSSTARTRMPDTDSLTRHRNLRSGTPLWLARARRPAVRHGALPARLEPDVVVVGAGISGALIADALVTAGHRVAVVDRRGPFQGSTPASTALLQFEIDTPLIQLAKRIGRQKAARAWWRSAEGVGYLRSRIVDLDIECDFKERRSLYLPGDQLDLKGLEAETEMRQAAGLRSSMIDRRTLRRMAGIDRPGAIYSTGTGEVDPVKLVAGLWRSAIARGARLYAPVQIDDVMSFQNHVRLKTATGRAISAKAVIFATGYELAKFIKPKGYRIASTWAYATRIQTESLWPSRCLIWEASDPYLYARTDAAGRVIVGGEDEEFVDTETRDRMLPQKVAAIERKLRRLMPKIDPTPAYAWTGSFGSSPNGLPLIGPVPGHGHCYAVLGYGGNGITFSAIAAQMLQRSLSGYRDPDAKLFGLAR
jgi:glycine/D-amino acid oxidase-like deaminating enzyme